MKMRSCSKSSTFLNTRPPQRLSTRIFRVYSSQKIELSNNVIAVAPSRTRPRGIVHFLGGAFVSASPVPFYSAFIDYIADSGYTVLATPYKVTFQHDKCAVQVHSSFLLGVEELRRGQRTAWAAPTDAPIHGLGHSNGALLHAMIGSLLNPSSKSNVLISFNNRQVADAVPLPLTPLQSLVIQPLRGNSRLETMIQDTNDQILSVATRLGALDEAMQRVIQQQRGVVEQLGSVFDEVGDGDAEFSPSPTENQQIFSTSYSIPKTMLIKFMDDTIDQTEELEGSLRQKYDENGAVTTERLPGNHLTPVGLSPQALVTGPFGPMEALGQAALSLSQAELRQTAQKVVRWMDLV